MRLDYIHKLLRLSGVTNRILLDKYDLIKFRHFLKTHCSTSKRYKVFVYINSYIQENILKGGKNV